MSKKFESLIIIVSLVGITRLAYGDELRELTQDVDPFIGTAAGLGNTFPGACVPFGMVQLSPDTTIRNCSGYDYAHNTIEGFSFTHLSGTGCSDYGNILFMPTIGEIKIVPGSKENPDEGYRSRFAKESEKASPGYYSVVLKDYAVKTELTVTKRAGFFRFTFPETDNAHSLIDLHHRIGGEAVNGYVKIVDSNTIEGYSYCNATGGGWCGGSDYTVYFSAKFSKPFDGYGTWKICQPMGVPESALIPPDGEEEEYGLKGEYFNNRDLAGKPAAVRVDPQINFDWGGNSPGMGIRSDDFSVRWTGKLMPPVSGTYQLGVTSDDGIRLFLDDELLIDKWVDRSKTRDTVAVELEAGQPSDIEVDYYDHWVDAAVHLEWVLPNAQRRIRVGSRGESGKHIGAIVDYATSKDEVILAKVGISFVSIEGARKNVEVEIPDWNFDKVKAEATKSWNEKLNKIEVEGGTAEQKVIFYTALYHTLIHPNIFSDIDGKYYGMDHEPHTAARPHYAIFSGWDVFRAEMPLLTLVEPAVVNDVIQSLLSKYEQGGWLPIWEFANSYSNCMIGDPAVPVIVDAWMKGIRDFDVEKAYAAMRKSAMELPPLQHLFKARRGLENYKRLGYIPVNTPGVWASVSTTLEYAYPDWCLARMARDLGKDDDYELFLERAGYYRNVFDGSTGFMRPRNRDGSWVEPFDPLTWEHGFCESNSWQQTWFVPHDVQGLIDLMGKEDFIEKLDTLFEKALLRNFGWNDYYNHGNEPDQHVVYFYNYAGEPWKTQGRVRQIMEKAYGIGPEGICGNDDCGQTSAWYIFSAMGFYPVCPGQNVYIIGSPIFEKVTIQLESKYYKPLTPLETSLLTGLTLPSPHRGEEIKVRGESL